MSLAHNVTLEAMRLIPGSSIEHAHKLLLPGSAQPAEALQSSGWWRQKFSLKLQGTIVKAGYTAKKLAERVRK